MKHYFTILRKQPRPVKFLLSRLLMKTGLSRLIVMDRDGYRIRFHPAALSSVMWINPADRCTEERFLKQCVQPGDIVIDVGANIGTVTLALADAVGPAGHILAVEPHPTVFAFLEDNLDLNQVKDRVTALNIALGAEECEISFSDLSDDSQNHIKLDGRSAVSVPVQTLDSIAPKGHVRLIKIDVEGYEPEVMLGAEHVCERADIVYLECIPRFLERFGWSEDALVSLLEDRGFRAFQLDGRKLRPNVVGDKEKKMLLCLRDPHAFAARTGMSI